MDKRFTTTLLATILYVALITGVAQAMSSTNYRLDWFTPLTGTGGSANSTNYAINFTVGQVAPGTYSSTSYDGCLGYWCGAVVEYQVYLPVVLRN